jgi:hypothetical protein
VTGTPPSWPSRSRLSRYAQITRIAVKHGLAPSLGLSSGDERASAPGGAGKASPCCTTA